MKKCKAVTTINYKYLQKRTFIKIELFCTLSKPLDKIVSRQPYGFRDTSALYDPNRHNDNETVPSVGPVNWLIFPPFNGLSTQMSPELLEICGAYLRWTH